MNKSAILNLQDVWKTYPHPSGEQVQALKGISLKIREGSLTVIVGPSGSGKSTLLKMAGLLEKPSQGSVVFRGNETKNLSPDERASIIRENMGFILKRIQPTILSDCCGECHASYVPF